MKLEREGVDVVFVPHEQDMYPTPQVYRVQPPPVGDELDGAFRPGFFNGVCTVVLKLFNLVQPDVAVFGKKDRQQLKIVRGMVQQFNLPIQIVPGETIRADDGLALASRNNYLTPVERTEAPRLYRTLRDIADEIAAGRTDYANLEAAGRADLARHGWKVDYIAVRNGIGLRIPHPEGFDHPNLLIVLGRGHARRHAAHRQRRRDEEGRRGLTADFGVEAARRKVGSASESRVRDEFPCRKVGSETNIPCSDADCRRCVRKFVSDRLPTPTFRKCLPSVCQAHNFS